MSEEMIPNLIEALDELADAKGISKERLVEMIKSALLTAYKQKYGFNQNVRVEIDEEKQCLTVLLRKYVVEEVEDENTEISLEDAKDLDPRYEIGDPIDYTFMPTDFGRVAARTVKQVMTQKLVEAEREMVMDEFSDKIGEMMMGQVHRINGQTMYINLGSAEGMLPAKEQVPGEHFMQGQTIRVYVAKILANSRGPQVLVSRKRKEFVKCLFELEVPEIADGIVEIKGIARDPGSRTKMAVYSEDQNVDPVGACVGPRGSRVQRVVDELNGEKIDIVFWSEDPVELISNVLSPADVEAVIIEDEEAQKSTVIVPDDQLSLAIGKMGQNVSLAAKVSDWNIDIKSHSDYYANNEDLDEDYDEDEEAVEETEETAEEAAEETEAVETEEAAEPEAETEEPEAEEAPEETEEADEAAEEPAAEEATEEADAEEPAEEPEEAAEEPEEEAGEQEEK